jgi:acyl-coenzyme A thioesterase PaaI-like protein
MGTAVRSATDDGDVPATSQLTMTYLRPGTPGPVEVTARVPAGSPERVAAVSFRRQGLPGLSGPSGPVAAEKAQVSKGIQPWGRREGAGSASGGGWRT